MEKWIHPHWRGKDLDKITRAEVYDVLFHKSEMKSQFTRRNVYKTVRRIFQMAVEDGHLVRNPCAGITVRVSEAETTVLTNAEVQKFLTEAREAHHRFYPIWAMALMTGMRSGELFALKWSDCDIEARLIKVSKSWNSKIGITPTKTGAHESYLSPMT